MTATKERSILPFLLLLALQTGALSQVPPAAPTPAPQIPSLTASTAKSGIEISDGKGGFSSSQTRGGNVRMPVGTVGNTTDYSTSETTARNLAVKVQLRSSQKPAQPYDVECFFFSRPKSGDITLHDACKVQSTEDFDEMVLASKPLFGGHKEAQKVTGYSTSSSSYVSSTTVSKTRGYRFVGWIVRVRSGGNIVRMDASLPELKEYARKEAEALDKKAAALSYSPR